MGKASQEGADKKPKTDRPLGQRAKALPFDAGRRSAFIEWIRKGASISQACKLEGVSRETVQLWLKTGRADPPVSRERRVFSRDFDEASAEGIVEVLGELRKHAQEGEAKGTKAALAYLTAMDPRFGLPARLRSRAQELANEKAELEIRMTRVRVTVAEAAASGTSEVPGFGLAGLLGDEELPVEVRQVVAQWAVRRGYVAVERLDWGVG